MQRSTMLVTLTLASAAIAVGACSFPTILIVGDTGGSGGGTTPTTTGTGSASVSSGTASATSTSTSTAVASGSSASASSSSGKPCPQDHDNDHVLSWLCGGPDCADEDSRAFPGAGFQPTAIVGPERDALVFDFNCDGKEQAQIPKCALGCASTIAPGFEKDVACGVKAPLGTCSGLLCAWVSANPAQMGPQPCK